MAKPVIKFKTYRQAAAVGGKIYGVPNLGDPVVAEVTMQEVIDYTKLHNYSADTLSALLSQVIAGVGDLVARDGRPRMLSDLLKFEPVIKGTFDNMEQTVSKQKVLVRPRMLKEIKVALDPSMYSWQNQNDKESPKILSVAPASSLYDDVTLASLIASLDATHGFGFTYAGTRLCPNGWDANCSFQIVLIRPNGTLNPIEYHLEVNPDASNAGSFEHKQSDEATDNVLAVSPFRPGAGLDWDNAWFINSSGIIEGIDVTPQSGDQVQFRFKRVVSTGDEFVVTRGFFL